MMHSSRINNGNLLKRTETHQISRHAHVMEDDGICLAFICIGIAMYSKKEGVHKTAFKKQKAKWCHMQQDVRHRLPHHLRVMFFCGNPAACPCL